MQCLLRCEGASAHLCLGVPGEVEAAGVAGDGQDKGQGVEVDHVVAHIEELRIQTCRDTETQPEVSSLEKRAD